MTIVRCFTYTKISILSPSEPLTWLVHQWEILQFAVLLQDSLELIVGDAVPDVPDIPHHDVFHVDVVHVS